MASNGEGEGGRERLRKDNHLNNPQPSTLNSQPFSRRPGSNVRARDSNTPAADDVAHLPGGQPSSLSSASFHRCVFLIANNASPPPLPPTPPPSPTLLPLPPLPPPPLPPPPPPPPPLPPLPLPPPAKRAELRMRCGSGSIFPRLPLLSTCLVGVNLVTNLVHYYW